MKLVHSYHFFENKVKLDDNKIIDTKNNSIIQVLSNFYRDKTIFNVKIERMLNKKKSLQNYKRFFRDKDINCNICYNTKIVIDINEQNLLKSIKCNNFYDRKNFFALLTRNVINVNNVNPDTCLDDIKNKNQKNINSIDFSYLGKSIIKIGNLIYDLELERIYFNEDDIQRNKFNFKIENLKLFFTDNKTLVNSIFVNSNIFNSYNQNLILYSEKNENLKALIKNYGIENYTVLNDENLANIKYNEIVGKSIIISYETLITHYKYNISLNYADYEDTEESLIHFKERYIYETGYMNRDKFLDLRYIILHSLVYENLVIFDFPLNTERFLDNILLKQITFKQSIFISPYFLKYKVSSLLEKLRSIYSIETDSNSNSNSISRSFINNLLSQVYIDDYSNLNKEKSILFNYSKQEENIITNTNNLKKTEKCSLPLLFPIEKASNDDIKYINNNDCPICLEKLTNNNTVKTSCNHYFCINCINRQLDTSSKLSCSLCRSSLNVKTDFTHLVTKPKNIPGKIGKIFQHITDNSIIISNFNDNLTLLSKILTKWESDFTDILLINGKCINNKEFTSSKSLLFLENNVEKYTKYLYKNSELKVLVPIKELT